MLFFFDKDVRKMKTNNFIRHHKDLKVWALSMELTSEVYRFTTRLPPEERYGLASQMRSAALSIPSNIAEGAARGSDREFIRFLNIAAGSASELDTQIRVMKMTRLFPEINNLRIEADLERVKMMIQGLINKLRKKLSGT
jgi:four helix bundle protein